MCKGITLLGMQHAVSPLFLEVTRQHVVEEAADELLGGHGGSIHCFGFGVTVTKGDVTIFERKNVSVADSDAKDVGRQVLQGSFAAAAGDDVHNPVLLPEVR